MFSRMLRPAVRRLGRRGFSSRNTVTTVLGAQWGDEGKGKLIDILAKEYDVVSRFNGGSNAGHTLVVDGVKFAFHLLPCGLLYPDKMNIIGNGVVVHFPTLFRELEQLDEQKISYQGRLSISDRAHVLLDVHQAVDGLQEAARGAEGIGTTKRGIGPCYASKITRSGLRVGDLADWPAFEQKAGTLVEDFLEKYPGLKEQGVTVEKELAAVAEYRDRVLDMADDTGFYLQDSLANGTTVLAEGANAALLDIDHGTYPYVTSSSTTAGGICTGLGLPPSSVGEIVGVAKAYCTRVGDGPFPTECEGEDADLGQQMRDVGHEYGTTTGRPRRCGWVDFPALVYSHHVNGYNSWNITKLDVLSGIPEIKVGVEYTLDGETLPMGKMPSRVEDLARVQVTYDTLPGWTEDLTGVTSYEDLPENAIKYVDFFQKITGVPVSWVGVGPGREQMLKVPGCEFGGL